jgi:mRNA-degrading endonuclease HigB of HigAB toxin-antitoxin module
MYKLSFVIVCIIFFSCQAPDKKNALEYNRFLMQSIDPVVDLMVNFEDAVYQNDSQNLEVLRTDLKDFVKNLRIEISKKKAFDGNEKYKNAALEMLTFYDAVSNKQYNEIIRLKTKDPSLSENTIEQIEEIIFDVYKKEHQLYEKFELEAKTYALKYDLETVQKKK